MFPSSVGRPYLDFPDGAQRCTPKFERFALQVGFDLGRAARDAAALKMSAKEIQTAQRLVKEFKPGQPSRPSSSSTDTGIVLKGITGPAGNRLALINNKTVTAGERTQTSVGGKDVEIVCVEIGEDFVVIDVNGRQHRLELAHGQSRQ